jgi:hypothetical protein
MTQGAGLALSAALLFAAEAASASSLTTLFDFNTGHVGSSPAGQLVQDSAGNLYGLTTDSDTGGAIYELTPPTGSGMWRVTRLYTFVAGKIGAVPQPGLAAGTSGQLFGATNTNNFGENPGCGSVFDFQITGQGNRIAPLSSLNGRNAKGCTPAGPVNVSPTGDVFAITENGGDNQGGYGAILRFSPPRPGRAHWSQTLLYSFNGKADGFYPSIPMLLSASGALYGTALASSNGKVYPTPVFQLLPPAKGQSSWGFSVIHGFKPAECADGVGPLIESPAGTIFGACAQNVAKGRPQFGNVFSLTPPSGNSGKWIYTRLYTFTGGSDGGAPETALTLDGAGHLYGTTSMGNGTLFELTPPPQGSSAWGFNTLYRFSGADGSVPSSPLVLTASGTLIGSTASGGPAKAGTVFAFSP